MKSLLFTIVILLASLLTSTSAVAEQASEEWQNTVLSDALIKKIQESNYEYKKCVGEQMQKSAYKDMDSRKATEEIIKQCEPVLSKMREMYLAEKVPGVIADRHLRQIRVQITRKVLQEMIFAQASRNVGQP
jgi:hypothetical protein